MDKFNVGDLVHIKQGRDQGSSFKDMFKDFEDKLGVVLTIGNVPDNSNITVCFLESNSNNTVFSLELVRQALEQATAKYETNTQILDCFKANLVSNSNVTRAAINNKTKLLYNDELVHSTYEDVSIYYV